MKNSKNKGSKFERKIAQKLSLWWTDNERDDIFYLTSGSGARATQRKKKGVDTANSSGDIGIIDPIGKPFIDMFLIEVKSGYTLGTRIKKKEIEGILDEFYRLMVKHNLINPFELAIKKIRRIYNRGKQNIIDPLDFIDKKNYPLLLKWWEKAEIERRQSGRRWSLIIFQRDGRDTCVMVDTNIFDEKKLPFFGNSLPKLCVKYCCEEQNKKDKSFNVKMFDLTIIKFDDFLEWITPDIIKNINND